MAWTALSFSFGAILTSSQMNQLQANFTAMANGDAGAPNIQEAAMAIDSVNASAIKADSVGVSELAAGAVHRGELSTGLEEHSTTSTSCAGQLFANPDGYGFLPEVRASSSIYNAGFCSDGSVLVTNCWAWSQSTNNYGNLYMGLKVSSGGTAFGRVRYINSSPPYDLGDGSIGRFVYAEIKPNGDILKVWNADDPPWFNKIIKGKRKRDRNTGKIYVQVPVIDLPDRWGNCADNRLAMDKYVEVLKNIEYKWIELNNQKKLEPMGLCPIPMQLEDPGNRIIILDPPSDLWHKIAELMEHDPDLSPAALLHEGYLEIGNIALRRATPPGVEAYGVKWKC